MEKRYHANSNNKNTWVAILISDKGDFETHTQKNVTSDKEE